MRGAAVSRPVKWWLTSLLANKLLNQHDVNSYLTIGIIENIHIAYV